MNARARQAMSLRPWEYLNHGDLDPFLPSQTRMGPDTNPRGAKRPVAVPVPCFRFERGLCSRICPYGRIHTPCGRCGSPQSPTRQRVPQHGTRRRRQTCPPPFWGRVVPTPVDSETLAVQHMPLIRLQFNIMPHVDANNLYIYVQTCGSGFGTSFIDVIGTDVATVPSASGGKQKRTRPKVTSQLRRRKLGLGDTLIENKPQSPTGRVVSRPKRTRTAAQDTYSADPGQPIDQVSDVLKM